MGNVRSLEMAVAAALQKKMVFVDGPRQVGKTNFALRFNSTEGWNRTTVSSPSGTPILSVGSLNSLRETQNIEELNSGFIRLGDRVALTVNRAIPRWIISSSGIV